MECQITLPSFHIPGIPTYTSDAWAIDIVNDPESLASWTMCVEKYAPGDTMAYNNETNTSSLTKYCVYNDLKNVNGSCLTPAAVSFIGCVDVPPMPGPPLYNSTLVTQQIPQVDDNGCSQSYAATDPLYTTCIMNYYTSSPLNSTFQTPVIQLVLTTYDTSGNPTNHYLPLQYSFANHNPQSATTDHTHYPQSGSYSTSLFNPSTPYTFFAQIPSAYPSQICVCAIIGSTNYCSQEVYMGCIPRPTLEQSGYALVVDNLQNIFDDCKNDGCGVNFSSPTGYSDTVAHTTVTNTFKNPIPNAQITFVKLDSNGNPMIFDANGNQIGKNIADRRYYLLNADGTLSNALATYPWSTLDRYYTNNYQVNATDSYTRTAPNRIGNSNFLVQPPVGITPTSGSTYTAKSSITEYRPLYNISSYANLSASPATSPSYPYRVKGYTLDSINVYGINFSAIIPQMSTTTHQPIIANITTPSDRKVLDSCNAYNLLSNVLLTSGGTAIRANSAYTPYYVPAGTRWRTACRGAPSCQTGALTNFSGQDCSVSANQFTNSDGVTVNIGDLFLCTTSNTTTNCCSGMIPNNFTFPSTQLVNNQCPSVYDGTCTDMSANGHDVYAEAIACPGVYTTEVGESNASYLGGSSPAGVNNYNPYYQRPRPSDLTLFINNLNYNSSTTYISGPGPSNTVSTGPSSTDSTILSNYASLSSLPASDSVTGVAITPDPATGIVQASSICVYSGDSLVNPTTGEDWDPIGYDLNTTSGTDNRGYKLSAYLCDHLPQMCGMITVPAANSASSNSMGLTYTISHAVYNSSHATTVGGASWPQTLDNTLGNGGTSANGTCLGNWSTANNNASRPTRSCVDGTWGSISNPCMLNCLEQTPGNAAFTIPSTGGINGRTYTGTCNTGYASSGTPSITCNNSQWPSSVTNDCQLVVCPSATINNAICAATTYGTPRPATGCALGYVSSNSPVATCSCSASRVLTTSNNTCIASCSGATVNGVVCPSTNYGSPTTTSSCDTSHYNNGTASTCVCSSTGVLTVTTNNCPIKENCSQQTISGAICGGSTSTAPEDIFSATSCDTDSGYFTSGANSDGSIATCTCNNNGTWTISDNTCGNASCGDQTINNAIYSGTSSGQTVTGTCSDGYNSIIVDASYRLYSGGPCYYVNSGNSSSHSNTSTSYQSAGVSGSFYQLCNSGTTSVDPKSQCQNGNWIYVEGGCEGTCFTGSSTLSSNHTINSGAYLDRPQCHSKTGNTYHHNPPTTYCSNGSWVENNPPSQKGGGAGWASCS